MHGRTRSKNRMARVQIIIEYFFVHGEKERGGGWSRNFLVLSEYEEDLVLGGPEWGDGSCSSSSAI